MERWLKYTFLFVVLVGLQVLVFSQMQFRGTINAFPYVYFILALPFGIQGRNVLMLSALLGLSVDFFSGTMGVHMAAAVFAGFFRIVLLPALSPQGDYEVGTVPSVRDNGWSWFLRYSGFMVLTHHLVLYLVESFSFSNFSMILVNTLQSSVLTLLVISIIQTAVKKNLS